MIGYEDYNALGLPPEYEYQDRVSAVENKVIETLKKAGLHAFLKSLQGGEEWYNALDDQAQADIDARKQAKADAMWN
nr:MAG TPA: hypothetical protein [Caudoviricetes sp.]